MENWQSNYVGYREYQPTTPLQPYVECYWSRVSEAPAAHVTHRILPDGCIDIIVDAEADADLSFVVGTMTRPLIVEAIRPEHMVAVRFRPAGAFAFLNLPMSRVTDLRVGMNDFWKDATSFEDEVAGARSIPDQIAAIETELLKRLPAARPLDPRVDHAVRVLQRTTGLASIESLTTELGVTRQHLARKFDEQVGLSPKLFARVIRMQDLVRRVRGVSNVDWAALALDCGYYDQAHMISEFREFVGVTPARFHFSNI